MKKLVLLLMIALTVISCDLSADEPTEYIIAPVQDVTMPERYKVDSISEIRIRYQRPTSCHFFNGFYYDAVDKTRTVAIYFAKLNQSNCSEVTDVFEVPLNFKPVQSGTYIFKFWTGLNEDGTDHFTEYTADVP